MARYMRSNLGVGHTRLRPPTVVTAAPVYGPIYEPIRGRLHPVGQIATIRARRTSYALRPPIIPVVAAPVLPFNPQLQGYLHPVGQTAAIRQRPTHTVLRPPVVVRTSLAQRSLVRLFPLLGAAARERRPPHSLLRPPAVVTAEATEAFYEGSGLLAPVSHVEILRRARQPTHSYLAGPVVVGAKVTYAPISTQLAYPRRGRSGWKLRPPVVVTPEGVEDRSTAPGTAHAHPSTSR